MDLLSTLEPWWRFAAALLIGALIGLEREFVQQKSGEAEFAGIRTFSLLALVGAVAGHISNRYGLTIFVVVFIGIVLLVWASYIGNLVREEEEGITTEVVALLVPLLGAMVVWDEFALAAAIGVIAALMLALKPRLHAIARRMSSSDLRATLEFGLITAVILPVLPNKTVGPLDVINPFQLWLLVVLVSAISFLGYILIKLRGPKQGIGITGVLGGLVSSTATTASFAGRSAESPGLFRLFLLGILLASCVMYPRVFLEVAVVESSLLSWISVPLAAMLAVSVLLVLLLWRRERGHLEEGREEIKISNPLRLTTAVSFAAAFAFVLVAVAAANNFLGEAGVYLASALAGFVDVDAIALSVSELAASDEITEFVAASAIMIAVLINTAAKAGYALVLGTRALRKPVLTSFTIILVVGIIASLAYFSFGV